MTYDIRMMYKMNIWIAIYVHIMRSLRLTYGLIRGAAFAAWGVCDEASLNTSGCIVKGQARLFDNHNHNHNHSHMTKTTTTKTTTTKTTKTKTRTTTTTETKTT